WLGSRVGLSCLPGFARWGRGLARDWCRCPRRQWALASQGAVVVVVGVDAADGATGTSVSWARSMAALDGTGTLELLDERAQVGQAGGVAVGHGGGDPQGEEVLGERGRPRHLSTV